MKTIEVLGMGCARCGQVVEMIEKQAAQAGVEIRMHKITDPATIAARGIMTTPAVAVDGKIVHKGGVPGPADVAAWIAD